MLIDPPIVVVFAGYPGSTYLESVQLFELWVPYFSQLKGADALILPPLKRQE